MENRLKGSKKFEVMLYDAGPGGAASVRSLFNYMQSAGDSHSRSLGTSLSDFADKNLAWVYSRYYIKILSLPRIYEKLICETWRSGINGNFVLREFSLSGIKGEKLAEAAASLALIDTISRKPVMIPEDIKEQLAIWKESSIKYNFPPIEKISDFDYIYETKVRYEDMDINRHMNNASYAQLVCESVISEFTSIDLYTLDLNFRGEAFTGDLLACYVKNAGDNIFLHKICAGEEGRVILTAKSEWRRRGES
jgi:medium-chain acyl-[acyl-carrier-protein] hydrolase